MKKEKNIPKFTPEEVEGADNMTQNTEVKDLISDTEAFFTEEDEAEDFDFGKCEDDFASNSSFLSGVLTEYDVFYAKESEPEKILKKRVRAVDKADAKVSFYADIEDDVEITGIEEAEDDSTEDIIPEFWVDDEPEEDDDGDDYSDESPAYIYDADLD